MKCQIPYNFIYEKEIMDVIYQNAEYIDSIYFGFEKGCRTIERYDKNWKQHLKKLEKIKEDTGIKLAYVLNAVIDLGISEEDVQILDSNIVDIVIIAKDSVFEQVYHKYGDKFEYEISRFYYIIEENTGIMEKYADSVAFGFEKEIQKFINSNVDFNDRKKLIYIVNENCFNECKFKLEHNTNQLYRNLGYDIAKFECPYIKDRYFYTGDQVLDICKKYAIDIFKVCDRAFEDERLLIEMNKWIHVAKKVNDDVLPIRSII